MTQLVALDAAIDEAREIAARLGTSGARAQVRVLEAQREGLADHATDRETWLDDNASVLHRYSAVAEELHHRIGARIAAYEMDPPKEVLTTLGPPPIDPDRRKQWTSAVAHYAQARMSTNLGVDLADPAVLDASPWRHAANHYLSTAPQAIEPSSPVLRRAI